MGAEDGQCMTRSNCGINNMATITTINTPMAETQELVPGRGTCDKNIGKG